MPRRARGRTPSPIQDRVAEIIGDPVVGWKVGAAVRAVQILEGHDGPIIGRLFAPRLYRESRARCRRPCTTATRSNASSRFASGGTCRRVRALTRAPSSSRISCCIPASSSPARATRSTPAAASPRPTTRSPTTAAAARYVVAGGIDDWRGIDLATLSIDARIDGGAPIDTYTGEYRRDPVDILVETVNGLAERGIGLAAGDFLSTGSLTTPTPLHAGQTYVARFGDLQTLSVGMRPQ